MSKNDPPSNREPLLGLLTSAEVAAELQVPERWVRRALEDGRLKRTKVGKYVRVHPDDLRAFLGNARGQGR